MPKLSGLPEDTQPTSDDQTFTFDALTSTLKRVKWSSLRSLFAQKRAATLAFASTMTANADTTDVAIIAGATGDFTIGTPSGTPTDGQSIMYRIKDDGTARGFGYSAIFRSIGITAPTNTNGGSKVTYIGTIYNAQDQTWDIVSVGRQ